MKKGRFSIYKVIILALGIIVFSLGMTMLSACGKVAEQDAEENRSDKTTPVIKIKEPADAASEVQAGTEAAEWTAAPVPEDHPPNPEESFFAEEISDEIFARMQGKSFPDDCTTAREDLRYLHLLYKDLDGNVHEGEMVCNKIIADRLIDIFRKLYEADYPIERMTLIDDYDADDEASMSDNNTSCFNYRVVSGTNKISRHGLGLAVDLNPRYNPYVHKIDGKELIEPANGVEYADRSGDFDYKIDKDDLAYKLFTQAGFTWGGSWKNSKDYQHFQIDE